MTALLTIGFLAALLVLAAGGILASGVQDLGSGDLPQTQNARPKIQQQTPDEAREEAPGTGGGAMALPPGISQKQTKVTK